MELKFWRFDLQLAHTWRIASGGAAGANLYPIVLVQLTDRDGRQGIGEAASTERYGQPAEVIEAFLRKVDASRLSFDDIPGSMLYLDSLGPGDDAAKGGINIALVDAAARAAGKSVAEHFGVPFTEGRHLTSFSIGIVSDSPTQHVRTTSSAAHSIGSSAAAGVGGRTSRVRSTSSATAPPSAAAIRAAASV